MSVGVEIVAPNAARVARRLRRVVMRAEDQRVAFREVADEMRSIIAAEFQSQGRRGGGSWARITTEWRDRKVAKGQDPRILFQTHRLFKSLTVKNHPEHKSRITRQSATISTKVPYAARQGSKRPFMKFSHTKDRDRFSAILERHMLAAYRGR